MMKQNDSADTDSLARQPNESTFAWHLRAGPHLTRVARNSVECEARKALYRYFVHQQLSACVRFMNGRLHLPGDMALTQVLLAQLVVHIPPVRSATFYYTHCGARIACRVHLSRAPRVFEL
jgi:hypothetical protein